ncbi:MAG: hypothetical protein II671_00795 [Salinivirgaceae bacterium]|nr:hypothetical protein [Salinivirgaceae bacterium]
MYLCAMDAEILVVIPWLPSAAQGNELRWAVAGWRRHFKHPHRIVVVGEGVTGKVPAGCTAIESPRVADVPGMYRQHLDYVSCLRKVRAAFPDSEGYIMVADDCYAVNDFDMTEVLFLKQIADTFTGMQVAANGWQVDKWRTAQALKAGGWPCRNCTTHLPQFFEWDKVEALWRRYEMDRVSYTIEDLYYNIYYPRRVFFQLDATDNLKFGLYEQGIPAERIRRVMARKIWLTNSPVGWSADLEAVLAEHFAD